MYLKIHRGTHQIGGNLIEMGTENTSLLFDIGNNLPPLDEPYTGDDFELDGLTRNEAAFDGVFLSHYHNDHCGLLKKLLPGIPVFAGDETKRVLNIIADFTNQPRPAINRSLQNGNTIQLQDMQVTPIAVSHSARDAYMFLIQADGQNALYTGDFREAEEVPAKVRELLGADRKLDVLITEGTNIHREDNALHRDENWVTKAAAGKMRLYQGTVFVLCSSTNFDRIDAIEKAAGWSGRTVCEDLFLSAVRAEVRESDGYVARQKFVAVPYSLHFLRNSRNTFYTHHKTVVFAV